MNDRLHPIASELEAYVVGTLAWDRAAALEEHLVVCDACAQAMAREAQLEMALSVVAQDLMPEPVVMSVPTTPSVARLSNARASRVRRAGPMAVGFFGGIALAASVLLWLGAPHAASPRASGTQVEATSDAAVSLASMPGNAVASDALDGG